MFFVTSLFRASFTSSIFLWLQLLHAAKSQAVYGADTQEPLPSEAFPDEGTVMSFSGPESPDPPPPPPPNGSTYNNYEIETESREAPNGLEILVAIFFFVAAAWLLIAVFYAFLALVVLRMRSRGRLDIYDEEFGRFYFCGTRFYIPFGCILRRYVVAFGHDQPSGSRSLSNYRYISRNERRKAVEKILFGSVGPVQKGKKTKITFDEELGRAGPGNSPKSEKHSEDESQSHEASCRNNRASDSQSSEDAICSICLAEYSEHFYLFCECFCQPTVFLTTSILLFFQEKRIMYSTPMCATIIFTVNVF
jgi:hypothetical protein